MKPIEWLLKQDIQINQRIGGLEKETLSARCWRLRAFQPYKTLRPILDWAFFLRGPDHCQRSYENFIGATDGA